MNSLLPDDVCHKLSICAARERWLRWIYHGAFGLGMLLLLSVLAMTADWLLVWFAPAARWMATLIVSAAVLVLGMLIVMRQRRRTLVDTAQAAEARLPGLEERWSTLAALEAPSVPESMRGAPSLRVRVREEASALSADVSSTTAVPMRPWLMRAACWLGGGLAVLLVLFWIDAEHASVLGRRLIMPWRDISLTRVEWVNPQRVIPRHEPYTLTAQLSGRLPTQAQLLMEDAISERRVLTLLRGSQAADQLSHFIKSPERDFAVAFRAGDGQTAWQHITVADRPVLRAVYTRLKSPVSSQNTSRPQQGLPSKLRAVAGSMLEVRFESNVTLERLEVCRTPDGDAALPPLLLERKEGAYVFTEKLTRSFRFYPQLVSQEGLTNLSPPLCQVEVVPDQKPVLVFTEECSKSALTAQDTVQLAFRAEDDFGLAKVEARVFLENPNQPRQEHVLTLSETLRPESTSFVQNLSVKLAELPISPDTLVAFSVEVTDTGGSVTSELHRLPIDEFTKDPANAMSIEALLAIQPAMEKMIAAVEQARQQVQNARTDPQTTPQAMQQAMEQLKSALAQSEALQKAMKGSPMNATAENLKRIAQQHMQPAQQSLSKGNDLKQTQQQLESALQELKQELAAAGDQARQQAAAALAAQIQKMHQIFLASVPKLPKGTKVQDLLNRPEMDVVEADEATLKALRERAEKIRELLKQLESLLDQDAGLRARFVEAQSNQAHNLRDQLHQLTLDQDTHTGATALAALHAKDAPAQLAQAFANLDARVSQQRKSFLGELVDTQRKAVVWMPKNDGNKNPAATDYLKHLNSAITRESTDDANRLNDLSQMRKALEELVLIDGFADFSDRRMSELDSSMQQQTWLISVQEARQKQQMHEVTSLLQRNLWRTGSKLTAKITDASIRFESLGPQFKPLIEALITPLHDAAVPAQDAATTKLHAMDWPAAAASQLHANEALAQAEVAYDALLQALTDKMKSMPPGPPPDCTPSLERLLALLEKELNEQDDFGLSSRKLNVQMNVDWPSICKNGCCPKPSPQTASSQSKSGSSPASAAAQSERERSLSRAAQEAKRDILAQAAKADGVASVTAASTNDQQRRLDWNQLPSALQKDLRQQRDVPPPEEYRRAVESYFRRLVLEK